MAVVYLALVVGWVADGSYRAIDEAPNILQWSPTLVDSLGIAFEVRRRKEVVGIKVEEVVPALVKECGDLVKDLRYG